MSARQQLPFVLHEGALVEHETLREWLLQPSPAESFRHASGHFGICATEGSRHVLARDLLGVAKLFFALRSDGGLDSSTFLIDLLRAGHPVERISSVPSGHVVEVDVNARKLAVTRYRGLEFGGADASVATIRDALTRTFRALAPLCAGRPVYVTLSGGVDSTTIALLAREHLGPFTALTFAMDWGAGPSRAAAEDLTHAARVAEALGVSHEVVSATPDELTGLLDEVLLHGQDWRDFNVHCGLVNAALARFLEARHGDAAAPVVLTGDTMNELVADYSPVKVDERLLYELPRLPAGKARRFLVRGLDSGDREAGIFARRGVLCLQPYALCAAEYAALPDSLVERREGKQELARAVMQGRLPEHVLSRPKVRAQEGSSDAPTGTLAALVRGGIDGDTLARRFEALYGIDEQARRALLRGGMYRFATTFDALVATHGDSLEGVSA